MKNLNEIAIRAFKEGSDNFGETVTGVRDTLIHTPHREGTIYFGSPNNQTHKVYTKTVLLEQPDGHPCTSGIGFYVKDNVMSVCSGHIVFTVDVTPEIQAELETAIVADF